MHDFIKKKYFQWISPFISGLIEIQHILLNNVECDFILISRRDKNRAGLRFISRGCDLVSLNIIKMKNFNDILLNLPTYLNT